MRSREQWVDFASEMFDKAGNNVSDASLTVKGSTGVYDSSKGAVVKPGTVIPTRAMFTKAPRRQSNVSQQVSSGTASSTERFLRVLGKPLGAVEPKVNDTLTFRTLVYTIMEVFPDTVGTGAYFDVRVKL